MSPVATIRWATPPPSAIDERLLVDADGQARLEVARPRLRRDLVGTFVGQVDPAEIDPLTSAGPEVLLDVTVPDPAVAAVGVVAARVADRLRETPLAAAAFFARPYGEAPAGRVLLALGVVGHGTRSVEFELEVAACAVHYSSAGTPLSWLPLPGLAMGFMTPDAEGLGGVRDRAEVPPTVLGAISVELPVPESADEVSGQLAGWLHLPGSATPAAFEVRTQPAALPVTSA